MRRVSIPLLVVFALAGCTLDHAALTIDDSGAVAIDQPRPDVTAGLDAEAGFDALDGSDGGDGMDVPQLPDVPQRSDVAQPPDVPQPRDVPTTCGANAQACCGPPTACADPAQICYPSDDGGTSCGPCGHLGQECCDGAPRCASSEGSCVTTTVFGTTAGLCLDSAKPVSTAGSACSPTGACGPFEVCLPVNGAFYCLRCGDRGGYCCPFGPQRCQPESGACDTRGTMLPFCH